MAGWIGSAGPLIVNDDLHSEAATGGICHRIRRRGHVDRIENLLLVAVDGEGVAEDAHRPVKTSGARTAPPKVLE
jgi:hypothetical protein